MDVLLKGIKKRFERNIIFLKDLFDILDSILELLETYKNNKSVYIDKFYATCSKNILQELSFARRHW